jgi:hypothetical protein
MAAFESPTSFMYGRGGLPSTGYTSSLDSPTQSGTLNTYRQNLRYGSLSGANPSAMGAGEAFFRQASKAGQRSADTANHQAEPRIVLYSHFYTDPLSPAVKVQDRDFIWFKRHDAKELQSRVDMNQDSLATRPLYLDQTARRGYNLAEVNQLLMQDQVEHLVKRGTPLWKSAWEAFVGSRFFCAGMLHTIKTSSGFANLEAMASVLGPLVTADNSPHRSYIADLMIQGHATTYNYWAPVLLAGGSLNFVLTKFEIELPNRVITTGLRPDYNVIDVANPRLLPVGVPQRDKALPGYALPGRVTVYQWVPIADAAQRGDIPVDVLKGSSPSSIYMDAVVHKVADLRHGYTDDAVINWLDPSNTNDTAQLKLSRAQNYDIQRKGKPIEIIVHITKPQVYGQGPQPSLYV